MSNRLIDETSPYLLQHSENPVDWFPWGEQAFEQARTEDKPIFLSVGYSACHWCHVMAHESFEDPDLASILNEHFVSIKVDREERPDVDRIYMAAVQVLTGRGGWPMSVFLSPDAKPFYGGTYFPPTQRFGTPAFSDVLHSVADAWCNRRNELVSGSVDLVSAIQQQMEATGDGSSGDQRAVLDRALEQLADNFDRQHGGWGTAPKFPQSMVIEFLLRHHHRTGEKRALDMVMQTLEAMARGGMYDQLGGGFHRYSVDAHWLVPHFEKMLYDNSQLARVYVHAWQVTQQPLFRTIAEEILDYVIREMLHPAGGFFATQDADSEGEEGKFFVWRADEVRDTLGEEAGRFMQTYRVTERGSFEGSNVLELVGSLDDREALAGPRQALFDVRERRVHPGRDEKVVTSWNGLMLAAFAEAARVFERDDYQEVAERNAEFLMRELRDSEGRLFHTWRDGVARVTGFLEDYTHAADGLLELYQTTFDPRWYRAAGELVEMALVHFRADGSRVIREPRASAGGNGNTVSLSGFYDTAEDAESLFVRPRETQDNAVPSGNAMAAAVLLKVARLSGKPQYEEFANRALAQVQGLVGRYPEAFGHWLSVLEMVVGESVDVAIVGEPAAGATRELLRAAQSGYAPNMFVAAGLHVVPELLRERPQLRDRATAYVCRGRVCEAPVTAADELRSLLNGQ